MSNLLDNPPSIAAMQVNAIFNQAITELDGVMTLLPSAHTEILPIITKAKLQVLALVDPSICEHFDEFCILFEERLQ